jgi:hypothetical protein
VLRHAAYLVSPVYKYPDHAGYAALTLVMPYFECIESYHRGESSRNRSKEFFGNGLRRVFHIENSFHDIHPP